MRFRHLHPLGRSFIVISTVNALCRTGGNKHSMLGG
jgi:hypothetical protein